MSSSTEAGGAPPIAPFAVIPLPEPLRPSSPTREIWVSAPHESAWLEQCRGVAANMRALGQRPQLLYRIGPQRPHILPGGFAVEGLTHVPPPTVPRLLFTFPGDLHAVPLAAVLGAGLEVILAARHAREAIELRRQLNHATVIPIGPEDWARAADSSKAWLPLPLLTDPLLHRYARCEQDRLARLEIMQEQGRLIDTLQAEIQRWISDFEVTAERRMELEELVARLRPPAVIGDT